MHIALIRLTSLGDIILCMASLQIIKRHLPECSITWIADRKFADILDYNPHLANIIKVDFKGLKKNFSFHKLSFALRQIREQGSFDRSIDLHGLLKSAIITRLTSKNRYGLVPKQVKEPLAAAFYSKRYCVPTSLHAVARYTSLIARSLGFAFLEQELIDKKPYLYYASADTKLTNEYFKNHNKNIILVPETSRPYKNYPKVKFVEIANSLAENTLILHGSNRERQTAEYIAEKSPFATPLPRMNLNQLKAAISRADLVIGGDTGPTHIAWANNIPSITLFGATPTNCIYETPINKILRAVPISSRHQPENRNSLMGSISEQAIVATAEKLLSRPPASQEARYVPC